MEYVNVAVHEDQDDIASVMVVRVVQGVALTSEQTSALDLDLIRAEDVFRRSLQFDQTMSDQSSEPLWPES